MLVLIHGKHSLLRELACASCVSLNLIITYVIFALRAAYRVFCILESFQTNHLLTFIDACKFRNDRFLRFNCDRYHLLSIVYALTFDLWKDIGIFRLLGHLIIVVWLLEGIYRLDDGSHLLNRLINLASIFQESLTCDKVTVSLTFLPSDQVVCQFLWQCVGQIVGPHVGYDRGYILLGETASSASRTFALAVLIIVQIKIFFFFWLELDTLYFVDDFDIILLRRWHGWVWHLVNHLREDNVLIFRSKVPLNKL